MQPGWAARVWHGQRIVSVPGRAAQSFTLPRHFYLADRSIAFLGAVSAGAFAQEVAVAAVQHAFAALVVDGAAQADDAGGAVGG